jgi:hypothetical protein
VNKNIWLIIISILFFANIVTATQVYVSPIDQLVMKGTKFNVSIYCIPSEAIKAYEFEIQFDETKIRFDNYTQGDIFDGYATFFSPSFKIDNENGTVNDIYCLIVGLGNVTKPSYLLNLSGTALNVTNGIPMVTLIGTGVTNETQYLPVVVKNGRIEVRGVNRYDVNGDESVDVSDMSLLWIDRDSYNLLYDVNFDGDVDVSDLSIIWHNRS